MTPRGICRSLFLDVLGSLDKVSSQTDGIWTPCHINDQGGDPLFRLILIPYNQPLKHPICYEIFEE